jgi:hypothetical protein
MQSIATSLSSHTAIIGADFGLVLLLWDYFVYLRQIARTKELTAQGNTRKFLPSWATR